MKKGEIWSVDLSGGQGHEQSGRRPAIVVASANGLVLIIPLTTSHERATLPYTEVIEPTGGNGLSEVSIALIFQLKSIDKTRFGRRLGKITEGQITAIDTLLSELLDIP